MAAMGSTATASTRCRWWRRAGRWRRRTWPGWWG
uniref:Uncharacterized protein n=1 Tax=Oryza rufipogon TaxID=4529 RepID=A0A0E0MUY9_ORYRU